MQFSKPAKVVVMSTLDFIADPLMMDHTISTSIHMFLKNGAFNMDERKAIVSIIAGAINRQEQQYTHDPKLEGCGVQFIHASTETIEQIKKAADD